MNNPVFLRETRGKLKISSIGIEPTTCGFGGRKNRVASGNLSEVASIVDPQRTNERTSSLEIERGEVADGLVSSRAESLPIKADSLSAVLAMIASLPLSNAEKAKAVRRLMAERATEER